MPHQSTLTFGSSGTVDEVLVGLGDSVKEGDILAKLDTVTVSTLKQALLSAQVKVKEAQMDLDDAKTPTLSSSGSTVTAPDPLEIEAKEIALESAKLNLDNAQSELDNSVLIAPFDGLVAEVNILVGDKVSSNTDAIRVIDPTVCTVDTLVNEVDIFNVELGSSATVSITALDDMSFPATVTAISPAATASSGVVNYTVKLTVDITKVAGATDSLVSGMYNSSSGQQMPANMQSGDFQGPPNMPTGEQGTMPTGPSGNFSGTPPSMTGQTPPTAAMPSSTTEQQQVEIPTLKEGLSVSISIVIEQNDDALLVPSKAVSKSGGKYVVKVLNSDGSIEQKTVEIGMEDWQNTEILSGLSEGETIITSSTGTTNGTTKTTSTSNTMRSIGGIMGGGGPPP